MWISLKTYTFLSTNKKRPCHQMMTETPLFARFHSDLKVALPLYCSVTRTTRLAYFCSAKYSKVHFHKVRLDYFQPVIVLSNKLIPLCTSPSPRFLTKNRSLAYKIQTMYYQFYIRSCKNQ